MRRLVPLLLLTAVQPADAQGLDWKLQKNRLQIDEQLRQLAGGCGQFGFTVLSPPEPAVMEQRILSRLQLEPKAEADAEVVRWNKFFTGPQDGLDVNTLGKKLTATLADTMADPSLHDASKKKYVALMTGMVTPMLNACRSAVADPFVGATYVSGSGSSAVVAKDAADSFEESLRELAKGPGGTATDAKE